LSGEESSRRGEQNIKASRQKVDALVREKTTNGDSGSLRLHHGVKVDGGLGAAGATVLSLRAFFLHIRHR
jgi:hypothetical protein